MRCEKRSYGVILVVYLAREPVFSKGSHSCYLSTHCTVSSISFLTLQTHIKLMAFLFHGFITLLLSVFNYSCSVTLTGADTGLLI